MKRSIVHFFDQFMKRKLSTYFFNTQETNGRQISVIVDFEVFSVSSRVSKQPKTTSMEDLENSTEDDSLADCCPWFVLTRCQRYCTNFPRLGKVLINGDTPVAGSVDDSDESSSEDEEQNDMNQDDVEEASEEHEESVPLFTGYVPLRGSSFHQDCQSTLKNAGNCCVLTNQLNLEYSLSQTI